MPNVVGFRMRTVLVPIHQDHFPTDATHDQGISGGRSHETRTDNSDFHR